MIRRHGFTLIEMLLTMSCGSLLMVLAMTLLQQAMTLSSLSRRQCDADRATNRLCQQFRRDAHAASVVTTDNSLETTFLVNSDKIIYRVVHDTVTRTTSGEHVENEQYHLGESASVTIETLEQPKGISLTVRRQLKLEHAGARIDRHIAVAVGRLAVPTANEAPLP